MTDADASMRQIHDRNLAASELHTVREEGELGNEPSDEVELESFGELPSYLMTPAARGIFESATEPSDIADYEDDAVYFDEFSVEQVRSQRTSRLAVIVHFYYVQGWRSIVANLERLSSVPYDLYVTVPENRAKKAEVIGATRPDAVVTVVPNKGKDCYPFIRVGKVLHKAGYTKVLKLQTKKITGDAHDAQWQVTALDQLIPSDPELLFEVVSALDDKRVAMIGPARYYTPLQGALAYVRDLIWVRLATMYDHATADFIVGRPDRFGFFAGTMFWMRLDALGRNLDTEYRHFPVEAGQKDGTLAHALERLFALLPQVEDKRLMELTATELRHRPYVFEGDIIPFAG